MDALTSLKIPWTKASRWLAAHKLVSCCGVMNNAP
jgi:hypothetical protein